MRGTAAVRCDSNT